MRSARRARHSIAKSARTRGSAASTRLYAIGELAREAVAAFGAGCTTTVADALALAALARATRTPAIAVLVKGSRFMRMERVVAALTGPGGGRRALMLLLLSEWLEQYVRAFNVFGYITLRAVLATMTALVISFLVGPRMIAWLTRMKIGQSVRDDGPQTHLVKAGTPTMGGALILVSIVVTTLLWGNLTNRFVWVVLLVTLGLRRGRLGRRLAQGRLPQSEGPVGAREVRVAVGDRPHRRDLSRVLDLGARQHAVRAPASSRGCKAASLSTCRPRPT